MNNVYIDETTYWKIVKQAADNNGIVTLETKGYSALEIEIDVEHAKKEWDEILDRISEGIGIGRQEVVSVVDRYLISV